MVNRTLHAYQAIAIGASAGGLKALVELLPILPKGFNIPVIVAQHRMKGQNYLLEDVLQSKCVIRVKQADEKEVIAGGVVYVAPPAYHLLIEEDKTFGLSVDRPDHYSIPSIDALFESAAYVYREKLVGIILTGANVDGAAGIVHVRRHGGLAIAQDPAEAFSPVMPQAAIDTGSVERVCTLAEIRKLLIEIAKQ